MHLRVLRASPAADMISRGRPRSSDVD